MQFTSEQIKKAKTAKSADELLAMANAEGVEITPEQAEIFFNTVSVDGELTDEQLLSVAGGSKGETEDRPKPKYYYRQVLVHRTRGNKIEVRDVLDYSKEHGYRYYYKPLGFGTKLYGILESTLDTEYIPC